jgi:voltage-gated potassium channel
MAFDRRLYSRARAFARYYLVGIETRSGRWFDILITVAIVVGVIELAAVSVPSIAERWGWLASIIEWTVGALFLVEYALRFWVVHRKRVYVLSFWGVVDALAIAPFALAIFFPIVDLTFLRLFRILRIFSLFKLTQYTAASRTLVASLRDSRGKIAVFLVGVMVLILIEAFLIQVVEPQTFPTVPDAVWWTIVTVTTVGYGDIVPTTFGGKLIASVAMLTAFGIIAVPTGIVAGEIGGQRRVRRGECGKCKKREHDADANYCDRCGADLGDR